jgi:DNA-binding transcriptional regulator YiaG
MTDGDRSPAAIRAFRLAAGWTQAEFAAQIGVHRDTVGSWERGCFPPTGRSAVRLRVLLAQPLGPKPKRRWRGPRVRRRADS